MGVVRILYRGSICSRCTTIPDRTLLLPCRSIYYSTMYAYATVTLQWILCTTLLLHSGSIHYSLPALVDLYTTLFLHLWIYTLLSSCTCGSIHYSLPALVDLYTTPLQHSGSIHYSLPALVDLYTTLFLHLWIYTLRCYCTVDLYTTLLLHSGSIHYAVTAQWTYTLRCYCTVDLYTTLLLHSGSIHYAVTTLWIHTQQSISFISSLFQTSHRRPDKLKEFCGFLQPQQDTTASFYIPSNSYFTNFRTIRSHKLTDSIIT